MHPATTYVSHTDNMIHPSCPDTPIPPLTPFHASTSTAAASFPSVDLMQGRTAEVMVGSVGDGYRRRQSIGVGFIQAIIGALCIIFNAVSLAFYDGQQARSFGFVGHGFWIGMMFIVTGTLGLAAGKSRNRCTITAFMTMCIISSMFTLVLLSLGVTGAIAASRGGGYGCVAGSAGKSSSHGFSYHYPHYYRPPCYTFKVVVAMEACMAIAAFFEAIVSIWGAVICCQSRICCYYRPSHASMVLPVSYNPQNGQLMYLTRPQEGIQVVYVPPPSMSYSQGAIGIGPLSYQTGYHVQSAWCRPQQINVAAGTSTGTAIPLNSPPPHPPPPYQSYSPEPYRQPTDLLQKY